MLQSERLVLTIDEVAETLRVSRAFVYKEITAGRLEAIKLGRCRRVRMEALRAYVEQGTSAVVA